MPCTYTTTTKKGGNSIWKILVVRPCLPTIRFFYCNPSPFRASLRNFFVMGGTNAQIHLGGVSLSGHRDRHPAPRTPPTSGRLSRHSPPSILPARTRGDGWMVLARKKGLGF